MDCSTDSTPDETGLTTALGSRQIDRWKHFRALDLQTVPLARIVSLFVVFLFLIWIVQRTAGAPNAAFNGFPDEPAHFIGSLVSHDYFVHIFERDPVSFASDYYVHIPFFALGVWPPFFYELTGGWMWLFGVGRGSVLWLIAVSGATLATLLSGLLAKRHGFWMATLAGATLLLVPVVQWSACVVMVDITCSLFAVIAIVFFARFLERKHWQDSAWFGMFCAVSLLTKNSTYYILLVPPMVILAARRWDVLRLRAVWLGPAIAACIYLPWLIISRRFLLLGIHGLELPGFWGTQLNYVIRLWQEMSFLLILGLAGAAWLVWSKGRKMDPVSWCMLAVIPAVSVGIFVARVPVQNRLLVISYAALIYFAAEFLSALFGRGKRTIAMLGCVLVFGAMNWMRFPAPRADSPMRDVVHYLQARDGDHPGSVLVPSTAEGPWIAEFAQTEKQRPQRNFVRPTKLFGKEDWNGTNWQPYYKSLSELEALFARIPIKYCILARSSKGRRYPHDQLLEAEMAMNPGFWRLICSEGRKGQPEYTVYENTRWQVASESAVYRELHGAIGKFLW
jgi:hypothetical protein